MFFEHVGLQKSFQTPRMHKDIVLDNYEKSYFLFFFNSIFFRRILIDFDEILMMSEVPRCIGYPIVMLPVDFSEAFPKFIKIPRQKFESEKN